MSKKMLIALATIVVVRIFLFINFNADDWRIPLMIFVTVLGVFFINRIIKNSQFLYPAIIILVLAVNGFYKPFEFGFNNNPVPVWITDEQRREHGLNYDSPGVLVIHNKVVNYAFSFLEHYFDYFRGDFLFTNGTFLYFFDILFIGVGFWMVIKSPKGWKPIIIWLFAAPISAALNFQPPTSLKAANMLIPLTVISSFGALKLMSLILKMGKGVKYKI